MNNFKRTVRFRVAEGFAGGYGELFNSIKDSLDGLVGIQSVHGGNFVDLCLKTEELAQIVEARGLDIGESHYTVQPLGARYTFVSCFVPIELSDKQLLQAIQPLYGDAKHVRRLKHKSPGLEDLENGCRVVTITTLRKPLPTRLSFEGISIGFKYTGQPEHPHARERLYP